MFKRIRWVNPLKNFYLENGLELTIVVMLFMLATVVTTIFVIVESVWLSLAGCILLILMEARGVLKYSKVYY